MKIIAMTMVTNPDLREDPWQESISQMIDVFDEVVVVCGNNSTMFQVGERFPTVKLAPVLEWPQPEWSYEELPRHLNIGLQEARDWGADWIVKLDIDTLIHEEDESQMRAKLTHFKEKHLPLASFEKYQFFKVDRCYEKGQMPLALNTDFDIVYGQDETRYTDLCQPIIPSGRMIRREPTGYDIPKGVKIPDNKVGRTGCHVWNYDYSFKTKERATELLYHFDRSHAKWWQQGYTGRKLEEITPETALKDYLTLVEGRIKKCTKETPWLKHPKQIMLKVRDIPEAEFGHSLWGLL